MFGQSKIIIFLPKGVQKSNAFYLYGDVDYREKDNVVIFYVIEVSQTCNNNMCIGVWNCPEKNILQDNVNFVSLLGKESGQIALKKVQIKEPQKELMLENDTTRETLVIFYDEASFSSQGFEEDGENMFAVLQERRFERGEKKEEMKLWMSVAIMVVRILSKGFSQLMPVLKYSSIGTQLKSVTNRLLWSLESYRVNEKSRVKVANFFCSVLLDIALGLVCLNILLTATSSEEFPKLFLWTSENCVTSLRNLLQWLAGSPAGFKLNREFNNILAQFYLFHTEIWWIFLVFISPVLGVAFQVFTFLGQFGLTFQAAILSDILALVSFHVYCIYAYAARLYNIQLSGLISLWRLFLGRKKNPLRGKVDSCHYSGDQLFVGTLVFTILLFLLPTTLIYYIVFTASRLLIVAVGGVLTRMRVFLHIIPVYSSLLWLLGAASVSPQIRIQVDATRSSPGVMVLKARRVPDSFLNTVHNSVPDCIQVPSTLPNGLIHILVTGELLYPV